MSATHQFVYVLAEHEIGTDGGAVPLAAGLAARVAVAALATSPPEKPAAGQPCVILVKRGACKATLVLELASDIAGALQGQCNSEQQQVAARAELEATAHEAGLEAVSSVSAVEQWKRKCRSVFGVGHQVSVLGLCEMATAEARQHKQGRPAGISQDLMSLFASPL